MIFLFLLFKSTFLSQSKTTDQNHMLKLKAGNCGLILHKVWIMDTYIEYLITNQIKNVKALSNANGYMPLSTSEHDINELYHRLIEDVFQLNDNELVDNSLFQYLSAKFTAILKNTVVCICSGPITRDISNQLIAIIENCLKTERQRMEKRTNREFFNEDNFTVVSDGTIFSKIYLNDQSTLYNPESIFINHSTNAVIRVEELTITGTKLFLNFNELSEEIDRFGMKKSIHDTRIHGNPLFINLEIDESIVIYLYWTICSSGVSAFRDFRTFYNDKISLMKNILEGFCNDVESIYKNLESSSTHNELSTSSGACKRPRISTEKNEKYNMSYKLVNYHPLIIQAEDFIKCIFWKYKAAFKPDDIGFLREYREKIQGTLVKCLDLKFEKPKQSKDSYKKAKSSRK